MDLLLRFLAFLSPYGTHSYFLMFIVLLACGFGFPMPEDIVLVTGGILSARGICDFWTVQLVCFLGVLLGDGVIYTMGRRMGPRIKRSFLFRRILNDRTDSRVRQIFERYGDKVVFMGRFMPGLRMPIFMSAGIYRVSAWKFFLLDGFAAVISVPIWIYLGHLFGENLEDLEKWMGHLQFGIYGVLGIVAIFIVTYALVKRKLIRGKVI